MMPMASSMSDGFAPADDLSALLARVRACRYCAGPLAAAGAGPPRPILQAGAGARLLVVSQAPGSRGQGSGLPFADASGDRLRDWLGVGPEVFYDPRRVALLPMGFCYPGKGASGDLPPRPECAPLWHGAVRAHLAPRLTVLVGRHAQIGHVPGARRGSMTETVRAPESLPPGMIALPHPSWRSTGWMRANPWFERDILPLLRAQVKGALAD